MSEQLQAIATVLSLVNPAICAAIFAKIEASRSAGERTADALKAMIAVLVILVLAALFGAKVLETFGGLARCLQRCRWIRLGLDGI